MTELQMEEEGLMLRASMNLLKENQRLREEIALLVSRRGWTKEKGFILDGANADEFAAYDYGCAETLAAFEREIAGDTRGLAHPEWQTIREAVQGLREDTERMNKLEANVHTGVSIRGPNERSYRIELAWDGFPACPTLRKALDTFGFAKPLPPRD